MASTWSLLKKIGQKKLDERRETREQDGKTRIDKDMPLGLRFGGIVEISQVDFILGGDDLKIQHPGTDMTVESYGAFTIGGYQVHRYYLSSPVGIYVLQLGTDEKKIIQECKLFLPYDEVCPNGPQDWGFWLDENSGYIGYSQFQLKDGTPYVRVWENADAMVVVEQDAQGNQLTRIPPIHYTEFVHLDRYGDKFEMLKYDSMLYGRKVNDSVDEYLLVSAIEGEDGASIQIMAGLELQQTAIKVI
ncbi:MAG: DUF2491 family protein [Pseudomonadota bacterium]